jgi:hypothetical protein
MGISWPAFLPELTRNTTRISRLYKPGVAILSLRKTFRDAIETNFDEFVDATLWGRGKGFPTTSRRISGFLAILNAKHNST